MTKKTYTRRKYRQKKKGVSKTKRGYVKQGYPGQKKRWVPHSGLVSDLPKVGSKSLKFFEMPSIDDTFAQSTNGTASNWTGDFKYSIFQPLSEGLGIETGSGVTSRVGQRIRMRTLRLNMRVGWDAQQQVDSGTSRAQGKQQVRLMVIMDRSANQIPLTDAALVLDSDAGTVSTTLAMINMNNYRRYKIISDQLINIAAQETNVQKNAGVENYAAAASYTTVIKDIPIEETVTYSIINAGQGGADSIVKNNIYIIIGMGPVDTFGGGSLQAQDFNLRVMLKTRLYFTD